MVIGAANSQSWRFELSEDLRHVGMQLFFDSFGDKGFAILRAENEVDQDRREGLGHVLVLLRKYFALSALQGWRRISFPGALPQAFALCAVGAPIQDSLRDGQFSKTRSRFSAFGHEGNMLSGRLRLLTFARLGTRKLSLTGRQRKEQATFKRCLLLIRSSGFEC